LREHLDSKIVTTRLGNEAGAASVPNILTSVDTWDELVRECTAAGLGTDVVLQTPYGDSGKTTFFLTGQADTASVVRAMRGGAEDCLEKTADKDVLLEAVHRALARDQRAREERLERRALRNLFDTLSPREREVLDHVLRGRMNKQIASDLGIHERTVKVHRKAVMTKLNVRSVASLARLSNRRTWTPATVPSGPR